MNDISQDNSSIWLIQAKFANIIELKPPALEPNPVPSKSSASTTIKPN